jgi:hypothetical protein
MNIVFVTLIYGIAMPVLFIIAVFALVIVYYSEKALLYYSYRQPPSYDSRLPNRFLKTIQWAPVPMLLFNYWVFSSKQLLSNDYLEGREHANDSPRSNHTFDQVVSAEGW